MPIWESHVGDRVALPSAKEVAAWKLVRPGLASEMLAEIKSERRHVRLLKWAEVALDVLPWASRIAAITSIWHLADAWSAQSRLSPSLRLVRLLSPRSALAGRLRGAGRRRVIGD